MIVTFLLGDGPPPFRPLWEGELPEAPLAGETLAFGGRTYRVEQRSWRVGTPPGQPDAPMIVAVGLLLTQVGGPQHVLAVHRSPMSHAEPN